MRNHIRTQGILTCSLLALAGCAKPLGTAVTENSSLSSEATQSQVKVNMIISDAANNIIYSDLDKASTLVMRAGQSYTLMLAPTSSITGLTYSLKLKNTSVVNSAIQTVSLVEGRNTLSVASQGDYSLTLQVAAPGMIELKKYYNASVTCANPTFAAGNLSGASISATKLAGQNLYSYAVSGIAGGQAPYTCAWDGTGAGIVHTGFKDCASSGKNFYTNYVENRLVTVLVKDACNIVHPVTKAVSLPYSVPAVQQGILFIHGIVSATTGIATGDKRTDAVHYLATNASTNNVVYSHYSNSAKTFTISSSMRHQGIASSIDYGMNIEISGITGDFNLAAGSGNLSAASARIRSISYSTDQSGDSAKALSFRGTSCSLSNQQIAVRITGGGPCAAGMSGSGNRAEIEMSGNYSCVLTNSAGSMTIAGSFNGVQDVSDSCYSPGVVGGNPPIQL